MKNLSTVTLAASLLLVSFSAVQASDKASTLLDQSARTMTSHQWLKGAYLSRQALALPKLTTRETMAAFNNLCIQQTKLGEYSDAVSTCGKSIEAGPAEWANYINRGNLLSMMGDFKGAQADYARAIELNPAHPTVMQASSIRHALPSFTTPSFVALAATEVRGPQRADVGQ